MSREVFPQDGSVGTYDDKAKTIERALEVLRNVVGLNVDAYNWSVRAYGKDLFWDVLPYEFMSFDFWTDGSQLFAVVDVVDGKLRAIHISVHKGVLLMVKEVQQATNEVDAAKGFLSRYQAYCGATHVEAFKTILNTVEPQTNITKVYGNIKFEAEYTKPASVRFMWIYTFNGAVSSFKWVALNFENGNPVSLIDYWNFFEIGSYDINVDEAKAVEIAVNAVKNYSYRVYMGYDTWITVSGFKVVGAKVIALMFTNGLSKQEARDGNPLKLFPQRIINVYFDGSYPGGVHGVQVKIWADTGEIRQIVTLTSGLGYTPPPEEGGGESGDQSCSGSKGGGEGQADSEDQAERASIVPDDAPNNGTGLNLTQVAIIALPITIGMALAMVKIHSKWKSKPIKGDMAIYLLISLIMFSAVRYCLT